MRQETILETERLLLRPWRDCDAGALYELAKDPEVGPRAGWPVHESEENSREIIRTVLSEPETYAILRKEDGALIGSAGLKNLQQESYLDSESSAELGYWIGRVFWGKGYMPEAAGRLLKHAFEDLKLERVTCGYYEGNEQSRRVQEKLGFVPDHVEENAEVSLLGERRREYWQVLLRPMYLQNKARRRNRMHYIETSYRICSKRADGSVSAEIEFPELTKGNYRIVRLFAAPEWEGQGVREELLEMAVERIRERGGNVSSSDPFAAAWLEKMTRTV